ncbi:23S rRNA (uracil(1939)-C(5))-methyltransferase RlmD [Neisseria animalis]|uniref:23S rRNA (uracil(1939)-C(5))-methyltransferase RlmD n=1 Tax=Neisseria animalis TaxID=492 RepID=A0A5P3MQ84_NEIAN|nr:23S rRNA (uracil(1939)-C(5))-methyltransferase RlmD [Neisseria animalis]QEY23590.1 23S rRNA (uracil(1939)-C(5))-methyltransferase RlmD [Neisseria animalis]ROW32735.1 23S rRNA (uracil(1939)-C(5))-methyltransferase RlmD [Neisseria animalis]VEE09288.1 tRNA methyltransferase [Neisseria animalis]
MQQNQQNSGVAEIYSLDYEGRGVARVGGKTVFVRGALPSEKVRFRVVRSKKQFDEAETTEVLQTANERVEPRCRHFGICGGCVLQHAEATAQVAYKQRIMEEQLARIGKVVPQQLLPPIYGTPWHYRDRARLSISADGKGRLQLGFQAQKSHDVVDIESCAVLPEYVSAALPDWKAVLQTLSDYGDTAKFIEFYRSNEVTLANIGWGKGPSAKSLARLREWFDRHYASAEQCWQIWLQCGREQAQAFYPHHVPQLAYTLPEFDVVMPYRPGDFTQINAETNALMVGRALRLLEIRQGERVADLFCGLGNFSLPMAKCGAKVVGIEGSATLAARATENAAHNGCAAQTEFMVADLFETDRQTLASWGRFDKMLLDPPRSGAYAVVQALHEPYLPQKIVYVSCNPATFARDAAVLVAKGYVLQTAGVMNMFAQTAHVESIGVFERSR